MTTSIALRSKPASDKANNGKVYFCHSPSTGAAPWVLAVNGSSAKEVLPSASTFNNQVVSPAGALTTFISNSKTPLVSNAEASKGVSVKRPLKPSTVPSLFRISNSATMPYSASSDTSAGVVPPQQSQSCQSGFIISSNMTNSGKVC